jgi:hypothetical protein
MFALQAFEVDAFEKLVSLGQSVADEIVVGSE